MKKGQEGSKKAREKTNQTLAEVGYAMRIDYFDNREIIKEWQKLLKNRN